MAVVVVKTMLDLRIKRNRRDKCSTAHRTPGGLYRSARLVTLICVRWVKRHFDRALMDRKRERRPPGVLVGPVRVKEPPFWKTDGY